MQIRPAVRRTRPSATNRWMLLALGEVARQPPGYDTKFAMHALRLGVRGTELLGTGRITLPVPEPDRTYLRSVRRGEIRLGEVVAAIEDAEQRLIRLRESSAVAVEPDRGWVDAWLHRSYLAHWSRS